MMLLNDCMRFVRTYLFLSWLVVVDHLNAHFKANDVHDNVQKVIHHILEVIRWCLTPPFLEHHSRILSQVLYGGGKGYVQCLVVLGINKLMIEWQ